MKIDEKVVLVAATVAVAGGYLFWSWKKRSDLKDFKKKYNMSEEDYQTLEALKKEKGLKEYPSPAKVAAIKKSYGMSEEDQKTIDEMREMYGS